MPVLGGEAPKFVESLYRKVLEVSSVYTITALETIYLWNIFTGEVL